MIFHKVSAAPTPADPNPRIAIFLKSYGTLPMVKGSILTGGFLGISISIYEINSFY